MTLLSQGTVLCFPSPVFLLQHLFWTCRYSFLSPEFIWGKIVFLTFKIQQIEYTYLGEYLTVFWNIRGVEAQDSLPRLPWGWLAVWAWLRVVLLGNWNRLWIQSWFSRRARPMPESLGKVIWGWAKHGEGLWKPPYWPQSHLPFWDVSTHLTLT